MSDNPINEMKKKEDYVMIYKHWKQVFDLSQMLNQWSSQVRAAYQEEITSIHAWLILPEGYHKYELYSQVWYTMYNPAQMGSTTSCELIVCPCE